MFDWRQRNHFWRAYRVTVRSERRAIMAENVTPLPVKKGKDRTFDAAGVAAV
jgi:hypothetical protein